MKKNKNVILGVSFGHGDSSAAIIVDGELIAAVEEERLIRIKHYGLFPTQAVRYCLEAAKVSGADVGTVAIAKKPLAHLVRRAWTQFSHPAVRSNQKPHGHPALSSWLSTLGLSRSRIHRLEHHVAHGLSARFLSPEEKVAVLTIDGLGDFVSATYGVGTQRGYQVLGRIFFPHSLGFFYTAMTQFLGFPHFGDEFKVMGLSSLGKPTYLPALRNFIREKKGFQFQLNLEAFPLLKKPIGFRLEDSKPKSDPLYHSALLTQTLGLSVRKPKEPLQEEHADLAKSVQLRFEEIANHLLKTVSNKIDSDVICLAGGCAHNSVWIGKIPQNSGFRSVHVAPASHDAGIAVGAAISAYGNRVLARGGNWALLGPKPSPMEVPVPQSAQSKEYRTDKESIQFLVEELVLQKIIAVCQGPLEFGPRALGNRSILADPRLPEMKDRLNARVKHREPFRPFAASVLAGHEIKWFKNAFFSPYMEAVFEVREDCRSRIGAVVHNDGSCRIQSVQKDTQPFYFDLLEAFRQKTGVPMLINTSFNDNEPIVCTEKDAVDCFLGTDLDHLILGKKIYSKATPEVALAG